MSQETLNIRSSQANFQIFNKTQTYPGPTICKLGVTANPAHIIQIGVNWLCLVSKQIPNGYHD